MIRFDAAPWPTSLRVVSALATAALAGATLLLLRAVPQGTRAPLAEQFGTALTLLPAAILAGGLLFLVRGYAFEDGALFVERLLWRTRVDLGGLERAWHDPKAMCRSIRLFGNGGLFAVTGLFRSSRLGTYRAFVTDPKRAVVLGLAARTVVISPAEPAAFLDQLRTVCPAAALGAPLTGAWPGDR